MVVNMLPEEIVFLICSELGLDRDFKTLFTCALANRTMADAALGMMYRYHDQSPAFNFTEDEVREKGGTSQDSQHNYKSWTKLWRSIIVSSLGSTTYRPYCRYMRVLDFVNLAEMLQSPHFRAVKRSFYAKPLSSMAYMKQEGKYEVVDVVATINAIGELIVPKCNLVEEMTGNLRPGFLTRWISLLPRLIRLRLDRGDALSNEAGLAIASNCENFQSLSLWGWLDSDADQVFATFLTQLGSNSLKDLAINSSNNVGGLSFSALGRHKKLRTLKLNNLSREAMEQLNGLRDCTELEVLSLEDSNGGTRLQELHNDVFTDVVEWLKACTKLRDITIKRFFSDGPAILAAVAIFPEVRWMKLCLEGYTVRDSNSATFHSALAHQKSLEALSLKGIGEYTSSHDLDLMVDSICQLENLKELLLRQVSDEFDMNHISTLALHLPLLEKFWTSGQELSSDILPLLANLRSLRDLNLDALTQFDLDAILDFIYRLDPIKQHGFIMSLSEVDQDFALSDEQQRLITDSMTAQVGGRFEFGLARGPAAGSDDSDDD